MSCESESAHNEARALLDIFIKLERWPERGGGRAKAWQALHEEALDLLIRSRVQPAIVSLFEHLLRQTKASPKRLNRTAAIHAAAKAEAGGAKPGEIHAAYAMRRGKPNTLRSVEWEPAKIDRNEVINLRKTPYYGAVVDSYRSDQDD